MSQMTTTLNTVLFNYIHTRYPGSSAESGVHVTPLADTCGARVHPRVSLRFPCSVTASIIWWL